MNIRNLLETVCTTFPPINDETMHNRKYEKFSIIERCNHYYTKLMDMVHRIPEHEWYQTFNICKSDVIHRLETIFKDIITILERNLPQKGIKTTLEINTREKDKEIISKYFFNRNSPLFLESRYTKYLHAFFYRVRKDDKNDWSEFTQTSLFHISKKQDFNRNYRYSSSKLEYPILYLANSPFLALKECRIDNLESDFCIAGYLPREDVKVLNFSYSFIEPFTIDYIYKIPFIFSSSFVVKDSEHPYEYILPQLIMDTFIENNCKLMVRGNYETFDGICYQSTHSENKYMYNIAFPALECNPTDGYCNKLTQLFKVTVPLHIEAKSLISTNIDYIIKEQLTYMPKDYIRNNLKDIKAQQFIKLNEYKIMYFNEAIEYFHPLFDIKEWYFQYFGKKKDNIKYISKFDIEDIRIKLLKLREELISINSTVTFKSINKKYPNIFHIKTDKDITVLNNKLMKIIIK